MRVKSLFCAMVLIFCLICVSYAGDLTINFNFVDSTGYGSLENEGEPEAVIYGSDSSYIENNIAPISEISTTKEKKLRKNRKKNKRKH